MSKLKCLQKWGQNLKKPPQESKTTRLKLNDLVTLERGHLSWFRYPTHNIGTYLGRGDLTFIQGPAVVRMSRIRDFYVLIMLYMLHVTCFSDFISNSCWYVLAWFSTQHLPSLHNAACCVSNFGVLELQQKYNSYYSSILT